MAGLEVVVRPVVFPNIRPPQARVLPPPVDSTQGFCTLSGSGGRLIDLQHSYSSNFSSSAPHQETKRQFDKERVYQKDANGKINKKNFIDVERLKKLRANSQDSNQDPIKIIFADPPPADNVETLESDQERTA